ncbi:hypothetical protein HHI36_022455 [Cryptolaemus montrouzieri]|uniref:Leucine-rich repeat domain-containing protein n=1 Tax=Cryptolaemus montrouzieri TaxID=559131 RepID=A0ABD2MZX8_9CUCU
MINPSNVIILKMFLKKFSLLTLVCLVPHINSHEKDDDPVDLLTLKHVQIDNYNGPLTEENAVLLRNVEILDIRQSNLTPMHQSFLNSMPKLKKLSISNSNIAREVRDISNCCKQLKEFELINSGLPSLSWHLYGKWPLVRLYVHKEKLPHLKENILKDTKMKELTIEYSGVETIDDSAFTHLLHLETLNLQNNKIKQITKELLTPLKNVKEINLKGNLLEKLTTDQFPSLPNLEKLDVGHNPIKEFNLEGIKQLAPKLAEVEISGIEVDTSKNGGVNLLKHSIL